MKAELQAHIMNEIKDDDYPIEGFLSRMMKKKIKTDAPALDPDAFDTTNPK